MTNTVSVITGGSSGLGLALAQALASRGGRVVLLARDPGKLASASTLVCVNATPGCVYTKVVDVANTEAVDQVVAQIAAEHGRIDLWINCAGVMREGHFDVLTDADFRAVFDVNVFGAINCIRAALPHLKQSRGQIVNIASMAAHTGVFGYTAYCASKHALKGFTESLYHELRHQGVTVQLICPPEFASPMADALEAARTLENAAHVLMIPRQPLAVTTRETLKAIDSKAYHHITGFSARLMGFVIQHFPTLSRWAAQRTIQRARRH